MSIEISVPVEMTSNIVFDVEPGTIITKAMIDEKIGEMNRYLECGPINSRRGNVSLITSIYKRDSNLEVTSYDRDTEVEDLVEVQS